MKDSSKEIINTAKQYLSNSGGCALEQYSGYIRVKLRLKNNICFPAQVFFTPNMLVLMGLVNKLELAKFRNEVDNDKISIIFYRNALLLYMLFGTNVSIYKIPVLRGFDDEGNKRCLYLYRSILSRSYFWNALRLLMTHIFSIPQFDATYVIRSKKQTKCLTAVAIRLRYQAYRLRFFTPLLDESALAENRGIILPLSLVFQIKRRVISSKHFEDWIRAMKIPAYYARKRFRRVWV